MPDPTIDDGVRESHLALTAVIDAFLARCRENGVVVFAGAGVSADGPSRVPGWFALNSMIVRTLQRRVTTYLGRDPTWLDKIVEGIAMRRDAHRFPPEYQAQVIEEQCGDSYFRALAVLDLEQGNKAHGAIARFARSGHLKAVVTTNFDRLIERALEHEGVETEVFADAEAFKRLLGKQTSPTQTSRLPILKVHGCVRSPSSMVDTLQQRLTGRGKLLDDVLAPWLTRHALVYAGFSAADLNHDPGYLGLRRTAKECPGAMYVQYPGSTLEPGAQALMAAYETRMARVEAKLDDVFGRLLLELGVDEPAQPVVVDADPTSTVARRLEAWAQSLDPFEATNILAALFDLGGEEDAAWQLLHKSWKARLSSDAKGQHYARYQYAYAKHCVGAGEMRYEETPQNFLRSREVVPQAHAGFALWNLYRGRAAEFLPAIAEAKLASPERTSNARLDGDLASFLGRAAVILHDSSCLQGLLAAADRQRDHGDLPRAGRLWAVAARLAADSDDPNQAFGLFHHCEPVAVFLGDDTMLAELHLALAVAALRGQQYNSVSGNLGAAIPVFRRDQRWPQLIDALLTLVECEFGRGDFGQALATVDELSERLSKGYEVYYPHLVIAVTRYHLGVRQWERARRELAKGRPLAESSGNVWAIRTMDEMAARAEAAG